MSFETVLYEAADGVARITLNRPDKHNALNHQLMDDLDAAFALAEADDSVICIILAGAGKSFCSGYDTKDGSYYITPPGGAERWNTASAMAALDKIEAGYQKAALNTALDMGVSAMFRYHGQMNAFARVLK